MENKTAEEKDWTVPEGDIIHVPDRLDHLFNRLGMQLRFHTISKRNELQIIANMTKIADDYASLQCAEMKEERDYWLDQAKTSGNEVKQLQEEVERLRGELTHANGGYRAALQTIEDLIDVLKKISEENYDDDDKKHHLYATIDRMKTTALKAISGSDMKKITIDVCVDTGFAGCQHSEIELEFNDNASEEEIDEACSEAASEFMHNHVDCGWSIIKPLSGKESKTDK